jgi:hypothetical protein
MKQDIHDTPSTDQFYPIGFRYPTTNPLDLRSYRYAKAGNTLNTDVGAFSFSPEYVAYTTIHSDAKAGSLAVVIDVGATDGFSVFGGSGGGVIGKNELQGGYIIIYTHALVHAPNFTIRRMITGNTATTGAGPMTVTLDKPLPCDLAATTMHAACIANPYLNVQFSNAGSFQSIVGVPTQYATVGQYLWLQTWGPVWCAPAADLGRDAESREVIFRANGSVASAYPDTAPQDGRQQHAGFVLANARDTGQGEGWYFLQIAP